VADTRVFDVNKDFAWSWFCDWDLLVFDWSTDFLDDLSPLLCWNVRGHYGKR